MMKRALLSALLAIAALGLMPLTAHAQTMIVDQSQTSSAGGALGNGGPFGQSFTPTLPSLNFVTLGFELPLGSKTAQVSILSGAGIHGTVLATSPIITLSNHSYGSGPTTTFTFATPVVLTPGSQYTIRVDSLPNFAFVDMSADDAYAGGILYDGDNTSPDNDLYFVEGTQIAAAPEPSSVVALAIGILGMGALALRARRRSVS